MADIDPTTVPLVIRQLDDWVDPAAAIDAVARQPLPAILDSTDPHIAGPRHAVLACLPARVITADATVHGDPFAALADVLRAVRLDRPAGIPYVPGWIGYFGYESGRLLEPLPATTRREIDFPDVRFGLYDTIAIADLLAGTWTIVSADLPPELVGPRPSAETRARHLASIIQNAPRRIPDPLNEAGLPEQQADEPIAVGQRERFLEIVRRAREYIAAGDIFQVNLCHHLRAPQTTSPRALYHRLRGVNPAHYSAYIAFDNRAILSASPELFLMLRGRKVITRPIKGTRPRTGVDSLDAHHRRALLASEKDRAELAMIIDLERNDLGRVCEFGSIEVLQPWTLEAHPTVYHLVATVAGVLRREFDAFDLLAATFPGGSITGAPKIRAMQIIDELETTNRSVYCGAIGHIGLDGDVTLNIAIRTILADGRTLHMPVGCGIVADSVPEDEYDESMAKGAGLLAAIAGSPRRENADHPAHQHHEAVL